MNERMRCAVILCILLTFMLLMPATVRLEAAPEGQIVWAAPFSISPTLFDPAEYQGSITSMMTFYALHDALLKPMPGSAMTPGLAESWSVAREGVTYEYVLRKNVRFHNGELMTAEDVKFSFERYRGTAAKLLKEKVAAFEVVDPHRVRVRLKEPWSDFMTFFGHAGDRSRLDRPQDLRAACRRGRVQEGASGRWAVSVRVVHSRRRAGP